MGICFFLINCWEFPSLHFLHSALSTPRAFSTLRTLDSTLCFKTDEQNLSCENEFCRQFHFFANQSHFHKNGFALKTSFETVAQGISPRSHLCCGSEVASHEAAPWRQTRCLKQKLRMSPGTTVEPLWTVVSHVHTTLTSICAATMGSR